MQYKEMAQRRARRSNQLCGDLLIVAVLTLMFVARIHSYNTRFQRVDEDPVSNDDYNLQESSRSWRQKKNISVMFYSSFRSNYLSVPARKEFKLHLQCKRRTRSATANPVAQGRDRSCLLLIICAETWRMEMNPGPGKFPCGVCEMPVRGNQKGIQCDNCNIWFNCRCISMSTIVYNQLGSSDRQWFCQSCGIPTIDYLLSPTTIPPPLNLHLTYHQCLIILNRQRATVSIVTYLMQGV